MQPAIVVKDLYFRYEEGDYVLKGVNLTVQEGEVVALMGSNGAGKTTLIKHFNGLLKPVKGSVKVKGLDTKERSVAELSKIVGLVFQNPDHQLFAETVEEELAFALRNFGYPEEVVRQRVEWALTLMDLRKYRSRSPLSLSGGERKRVAIASVLCYDPEIIVFDEPTIGQDYYQKQKIAQLLKMLSKQGKTVIVVTHDVEFVAENFNRVAVMANGQIIADGDVEEVLTDPKVIKEADLRPPQITECAWLLGDLGVPKRIVRVEELVEEVARLGGLSEDKGF